MAGKTVTVNGVVLTEEQIRAAVKELDRKPTAAEKHGMVRNSYMLLDPRRVESALGALRAHPGAAGMMLTIRQDASFGYDPVEPTWICTESSKPFLIEVRRG